MKRCGVPFVCELAIHLQTSLKLSSLKIMSSVYVDMLSLNLTKSAFVPSINVTNL